MKVLVLESSTSSAKALLLDSETHSVKVNTRPYRNDYKDNSMQDAANIFLQTVQIGRELCEGCRVDVIALSSVWHSVMLCDRNKTPVTPVYHWPSTIASSLCRDLRKDNTFVQWYYGNTGCMVSAIYPAFKLKLLAQQRCDLKDCFVMGQGSYNFFRLTGQCAVTANMVSGAGLLNIHKCDYDGEVLSYIGIGRDQLCRLIGFDETFPLSVDGATALGLDPGIPVVPAGSDGGLNQIGAGATGAGVMTFSVGTSGALRLTVDHPVITDDRSLWCYLSPLSWMSGAATQGCCNCVDWAKRKLFPEGVSYADIEKGLRGGPEDTPVFLPFLYGERCPGWDDTRQGAFTGILPQHGPHDFYHAVLEGVLFNLYQCYRKLSGYNGIPHEIRLSGGILNSPYWMQMCVDLFGLPMIISEIEHCSMIGGAVLGLKTLGQPADFLIQHSKEKTVLPNIMMTQRYEEKFEKYLKAYERMTL